MFKHAFPLCDWNARLLIDHVIDKNAYNIFQFLLDEPSISLLAKELVQNITSSERLPNAITSSKECAVIMYSLGALKPTSKLRRPNLKLAWAANNADIYVLKRCATTASDITVKKLYYQTYMERENKTPLDLIHENAHAADKDLLLTLLAQ